MIGTSGRCGSTESAARAGVDDRVRALRADLGRDSGEVRPVDMDVRTVAGQGIVGWIVRGLGRAAVHDGDSSPRRARAEIDHDEGVSTSRRIRPSQHGSTEWPGEICPQQIGTEALFQAAAYRKPSPRERPTPAAKARLSKLNWQGQPQTAAKNGKSGMDSTID